MFYLVETGQAKVTMARVEEEEGFQVRGRRQRSRRQTRGSRRRGSRSGVKEEE